MPTSVILKKNAKLDAMHALQVLMAVITATLVVAVPLLSYTKVQTDPSQCIHTDRFKTLVVATLDHEYGGRDYCVSVYYYDFKQDTGFGFNENTRYTPASLLKVPVMMAYLKMAEHNSTILETPIWIPPACTTYYTYNVGSTRHARVGETYTIGQLIELMIRHSDNTALAALQAYLQPVDFKPINQVYEALSFDVPTLLNTDDNISPREFSRFLIALYNATFMNRTASDQALSLLSECEYSAGIASGVPGNVRVAHKFGERGYKNSLLVQLHDCGIVFHPDQPYILCVMTKGSDLHKQQKIIAALSQAVYQAVTEGWF